MKRTLSITILLIVLSGILLFAAGAKDDTTDDSVYHDIIVTALAPAIQRAICDYYKTADLREMPGVDPAYTNIVKIERPNGGRTTYFVIVIEVRPYLGPHITVGKDRITIELSYGNPPKALKFEHLEDHPVPERYKRGA